MWFKDDVNGYLSGSGTAWYVKFLTVDAGTQTFGGPYASEILAAAGLAALVATFTF